MKKWFELYFVFSMTLCLSAACSLETAQETGEPCPNNGIDRDTTDLNYIVLGGNALCDASSIEGACANYRSSFDTKTCPKDYPKCSNFEHQYFCSVACQTGSVACIGHCIDPQKDEDFCGADKNCTGYSKCQKGIFCVDGQCLIECTQDQVACAGRCIDPKTDREFCGANKSCQNYQTCAESDICGDGKCNKTVGDAKCPESANYTENQDTPANFQWCCDPTDVNKAWTSTKESKLHYSDCFGGCSQDLEDLTRIVCNSVQPASVMCVPSKEAYYVNGNPRPDGFSWCCDTTNSKKAWIYQGTPALLKHIDCKDLCVENPARPGYIVCKNPDVFDPKACAKPPVPAGAKLGDICDGNDGICVNKNTWMYCYTNKYTYRYCAGDCASDHSVQCNFVSCSYTSDNLDSTTACAIETYAPRCATDKQTGSYCTNHIVRTIICKAGYECKNDDGFISCGAAI